MAERLMKDSGIEWIGMIPSGWSIKRTKTEFTSHKDIVGDRVNEFERLALTLNGVIRRSKEDDQGLQPEKFDGYQILRQNELVFKLIDLENVNTSRVGLSPYTGLVSPAYIVLSRRGSFSTKYAEYFFLSMWQREVFNHLGDDGVRSSLNASDLLNVPLTIPSAEEQARIVDFLDKKVSEIDAVISKTKKSIEEYKKFKQSIITEAVTKGLDPNVEMKESVIKWIGQYPETWKLAELKMFVAVNNGKEIENEVEKTDNAIDVYGSGGVFKYTDKYMYDGEAVLFGRKGTLGKPLYVNQKFWTVDTMYYLTMKEGLLNKYNYYQLIAFDWEPYITHTALPSVVASEVVSQKFPIPSKKEQEQIVDYLDGQSSKYDSLISKKEQVITELEQYKKSLIYEYVTGKKEVA